MHSISSATLENPYEYRWVYSQAVSVSLVQVLPTLKQQQGQGGEEHKKKDISLGLGNQAGRRIIGWLLLAEEKAEGPCYSAFPRQNCCHQAVV